MKVFMHFNRGHYHNDEYDKVGQSDGTWIFYILTVFFPIK